MKKCFLVTGVAGKHVLGGFDAGGKLQKELILIGTMGAL
jgi:hypothetical protein